MCGNPLKKPSIPKPPPVIEPAKAPDVNAIQSYDEQRRAAAANAGRAGSTFAGSDLAMQDANTASRQLLG